MSYFTLKCQYTDVFIVSLYETLLDLCFLVYDFVSYRQYFLLLIMNLKIHHTIRFMIKKRSLFTYDLHLLDYLTWEVITFKTWKTRIEEWVGVGKCLSGGHGNGWLVLPLHFWFIGGLFSSCLGGLIIYGCQPNKGCLFNFMGMHLTFSFLYSAFNCQAG